MYDWSDEAAREMLLEMANADSPDESVGIAANWLEWAADTWGSYPNER
jgi:hypothetical protein